MTRRSGVTFDLASVVDTYALWRSADRIVAQSRDTCEMCEPNGPTALLDHGYTDLISDIERQVVAGQARLHAHVLDLLTDLQRRGIPVGIVSGWLLPARLVDLCVDATGLRPLVKAVQCAEWRLPGPPTPDVHLLATRAMEVDPAFSVAVEHDVDGMVAAQLAGLLTFADPTNKGRGRAEGHLPEYWPLDIGPVLEAAAHARKIYFPAADWHAQHMGWI
jgi:beta-phosphoglucomutase-like phosphatase (HAD superfamily)